MKNLKIKKGEKIQEKGGKWKKGREGIKLSIKKWKKEKSGVKCLEDSFLN